LFQCSRFHDARLGARIALLAMFLAGAPPAGAQNSRNATLLSNVNAYSGYSGVWGYVHPDGREYAVLGTRTGTSILSLATPTAPVEVAFIPGVSAGTRDIRQYQTYLYIAANFASGGTPGLQVVSMADPDHPVLVTTDTSVFGEAEYLNVDAARALLFASEADEFTGSGGVRFLSLTDPAHPALLGSYAPGYRIHDFHGTGNVGYGCAIDNARVDIVDITNPAAPTLTASFATPQSNPHSSWTSADGRYLLVTNEDIPVGNQASGHPAVFDVLNPAQVKLVYEHQDLPGAVCHIPVISGATAAISYYTAGLRLWDLSVPSRPVEFGYYDTWGGDDFLIAGNYQASNILPSGVVLAADDATGLYVIQVVRDYGIVRGIVRETSNGMKPLAGVTVRALPSGPSTTSAADGSYALAPNTGSVTVQAEKYGYASQSAIVGVSMGSDQPLNFAVSSLATGSVKGTVRRASDGTAFANADVTIPGTPFDAITTSRGGYSFSKVAAGPITVRAEFVGFAPVATALSLGAGQHASVDFSLAAPLFYDDAEIDRGWTLGAPGDDATQGAWVRVVPIGTMNGSFQAQPSEDHTPGAGTFCFVTGNGPTAATSTVQGGKTTLVSPILNLSGVTDPRVVFWRWYYHNHTIGGPLALSQPFVTEISNDGGGSWTTVNLVQRSFDDWQRIEIRVTDFFPSPANVRVRFTAQNRVGGITEAAIDDFEYYAGGPGLFAAMPTPSGRILASPVLAVERRGNGVRFRLDLDTSTDLMLRILDVQGRAVATLKQGRVPAGTREVSWDGRTQSGRAAVGIYFVRVEGAGILGMRKFALMR
jgi:choice-of-anchor B domain-containing protein